MFNANTMVTIHTCKKNTHTVRYTKDTKESTRCYKKIIRPQGKTKERELQKQKTFNKTSIVSPYLYNYFKCKWAKLLIKTKNRLAE